MAGDVVYLPLTLSFALLSFLLLYASSIIKQKDLDEFKGAFFFFGVFFASFLGLMPYAMTLNPDNPASLEPVMLGVFSSVLVLIMLFTWWFGKYLIFRMFDKVVNGKGERDKYFKV